MVTLSSEVGVANVGFLRLLRRVTQALVVVVWSVDDGTLETIGPALGGVVGAGVVVGGVSENPSTVRKMNALPL